MPKKYIPRVDVKKGTFAAICARKKSLLVRLDDVIFARFQTSGCVLVCSGDRSCTCRILAIRTYATLDGILMSEDLKKIAHGSEQEARSYLLQIYHAAPTEKHFVVLELELLKIGRKEAPRD